MDRGKWELTFVFDDFRKSWLCESFITFFFINKIYENELEVSQYRNMPLQQYLNKNHIRPFKFEGFQVLY